MDPKAVFIWFFVVIVFVSSMTNAQQRISYNITTKHIGHADGLAGKQVNCGMQDSEGFIWFGTSNGLQRYDGRKFKSFTKEKDKLQDNNVVGLVEDKGHKLWISYGLKGSDKHPLGKVDIMDLHTGQVMSIHRMFNDKLPFKESEIGLISSNEKNELIIVTWSERSKNSIFVYAPSYGFKKIISGVAIDYRNPHLLLFRGKTIMYYNQHQTTIVTLDGHYIRTNYNLENADNFFPVFISKEEECIASTSFHNEKGRVYSEPKLMQVSQNGQISEVKEQFFEEKSTVSYNEIYFQTYFDVVSGLTLFRQQKKGLYVYDGSEFVQLASVLDMKKPIDLAVNDYFTTPGNNHWICTSNGVVHFTMKPNYFKHLLHSASFQMPFSLDHQVRSIYTDTGRDVFINSWGGFYQANRKENGSYTYTKLLLSEISPMDGFYFDGHSFWFTGKDNCIVKYDLARKQMQSFQSDSLNLWTGITTKQGHLLIGGTDGIGILKQHRFERISMKASNKPVNAWFYQLFYSCDGILWAVSNRGLFEIDTNNKVNAHYSDTAKLDRYHIPVSDIHSVYEDEQGVFWMATNGEGLIRWDRKRIDKTNRSGKSIFQQFTIANGLSSNVLYSVMSDDFGFLWISSEFGLMRFNPRDGSVKTYTQADGLTTDEFNRISYFKASDGRLYFGGMDGVNVISPDDFIGDSSLFHAPLRIVSFNQYTGSEQKLVDRTNHLLHDNEIIMQPGDQFFTLEFQLLDFIYGNRNYAYKIDGIDNDWNYINENSIRISGLPFGNYILQIKAQNETGNWSKNELKIPIVVISPLIHRWWFRVILIIMIISSAFFFYRRRTLALKHAKQSLERTVLLRTEQLKSSLAEKDVLLKEIHHRVKNNLQVIVSLLDLQQEKILVPQMQQSFLQAKANVRSISLIHENLYRHENLSGVELRLFIKDLYQQVNSMFNPKLRQVIFNSDCAEIILDIDTAVPFGLILNELLTNSYKYTFPVVEKMEIHIHLLQIADECFKLVFSDNGPGLPIDFTNAQSMGLSLIKDLSRQIGGKIDYTYAQGSVFTLVFLSLKARKEID
jgi:two-component sensor histidine kinase/ligand-binding sensor domain-containing protein